MVDFKNQKLLIGIIAIVFLIIGLSLGEVLSSNLDQVSTEAVIIGLLITIIIILLILGNIIVEVRAAVESKKGGKQR
tara:strand:+ start:1287 stop:1517 length:231 start_codon:yes stop_codon:yes gene_type:complete